MPSGVTAAASDRRWTRPRLSRDEVRANAARRRRPLGSEDRLTGIWYVVGFAFAGVSFVFLTIAASWLISHRNRGDAHKGLPYESGIDTYGDTHGRFGLSFYIYALLFVAFDIEVIFIYLWAIVFRDLLLGGFVSMLIFVAILLLGLAYAWRKGVLTWR
jgi:NADH-quinone oxidoreductase subunit A